MLDKSDDSVCVLEEYRDQITGLKGELDEANTTLLSYDADPVIPARTGLQVLARYLQYTQDLANILQLQGLHPVSCRVCAYFLQVQDIPCTILALAHKFLAVEGFRCTVYNS